MQMEVELEAAKDKLKVYMDMGHGMGVRTSRRGEVQPSLGMQLVWLGASYYFALVLKTDNHTK